MDHFQELQMDHTSCVLSVPFWEQMEVLDVNVDVPNEYQVLDAILNYWTSYRGAGGRFTLNRAHSGWIARRCGRCPNLFVHFLVCECVREFAYTQRECAIRMLRLGWKSSKGMYTESTVLK